MSFGHTAHAFRCLLHSQPSRHDTRHAWPRAIAIRALSGRADSMRRSWMYLIV